MRKLFFGAVFAASMSLVRLHERRGRDFRSTLLGSLTLLQKDFS